MTVGKGKHYCLGLDLEKLMTYSPLEMLDFFDKLAKLIGRILTFPLITIAAINGNYNQQYYIAAMLATHIILLEV